MQTSVQSKTENTKTQGKNPIYARRWFKHNFILITYENKGYDKKTYPKLLSNILKRVGGPTLIYTPLGT
jgi:hypothetical protein